MRPEIPGSDQAYGQTLDYLYARLPMFQRVGPAAYKKDLTNTLALLEACGQPHLQFRSVHIAGTNGKGSVTHLLAASCLQAGLRTGIYTSPHYRDFRERIKIGSDYMSREAVVDFVSNNREAIEVIQPSFFEVTVAMAFRYFADQQVDIAIVETGLGGRLDSTNVLTPVLSVITQIGWDHMDLLGHTLEAIAGEKAGIIKPGVPVVIGESHPETLPVFCAVAGDRQAPLILAEEQWQAEVLRPGWTEMIVEATAADGRHRVLDTDVTGPFQIRNIRTWLAARDALVRLEILPDRPEKDELAHVRTKTGFLGRWQVLGDRPLVLLDSAHNRDGLTLLFSELEKHDFAHWHLVFGTVSDKDISPIIDLLPSGAAYYFAKADVPRGLDASVLQAHCATRGLQGQAFSSVAEAFAAAHRAAGQEDLVLVCGSIFVVAEVLPAM
jgi:dihydrofolate synthase / folylpolyglutamate synthase